MSLARRFDRTIALTAGLAFALLLLGLLGPAVAVAAPSGGDGSSVVRFQDYTLPQGRTVQSVVVIHGNAVIGGMVRHSVVVVGGDATIESTAVVGTDETAQTSSIVVVGGHLTIEPGAAVRGKTTEVTGVHLGGVVPALFSGVVVRPIGVVLGWWQLLFLPIVALVVAALFPRPMRRVAQRVQLRFWPSLGWGLVGLVVAAVLLVVLAVTIVGLIVAVPVGLVVVPLGLLFCFVCVAELLGRLVLSSSQRYRENAIATAVAGAVLLSLVSLVPVLGGLVLFVATAAGVGGALMLLNEWRQNRRQAPAMAGGPGTPPGWTPPPAGWTPPQPPPPGWTPPAGWTPPTGSAPPQPGWTPPPGSTPPQPASTPPQTGWTPPPGWPAPPAGWTPPPGWTAPPGWPQPPAGWSQPPAAGPAAAPPATAPGVEIETEAPAASETAAPPASEVEGEAGSAPPAQGR